MVHCRSVPYLLAALLVLACSAPSFAQARRGVVEGHGGYAGFIDESLIGHAVLGGSGRVYLGDRVALGPEMTWMRGPGVDRDLFITGNATIDLGRSSPSRAVVPYVVAGVGIMRFTQAVGTGTYTSSEGTFTAGVGVRLSPSGQPWFVAPEFRVGGDGHFRVGAALGRKW